MKTDEVQGPHHREPLDLGSEVCLNLGVRKPLPLSQQGIGGVRFGQDVDKLIRREINRQECQKEGTDITTAFLFCSSSHFSPSLSSLPTIGADMGGPGTPGLDSSCRSPGAPACPSLAWLRLAAQGCDHDLDWAGFLLHGHFC